MFPKHHLCESGQKLECQLDHTYSSQLQNVQDGILQKLQKYTNISMSRLLQGYFSCHQFTPVHC